MSSKISHQQFRDILDFLVKSSLFLLLTILVLNLSNFQKHTSTEIFLTKESAIDSVVTAPNNEVLSLKSERLVIAQSTLNASLSLILLSAFVVCVFALKRNYPKRQSSFAIFTVAFAYMLSQPTVIENINANSPLTGTCLIMLLPTVLYFSLRKRLNKTIANSHTLLVFASQSGSAYKLAKAFKKKLPTLLDVKCISHLTPSCVNQYSQVLFIASTFGQGQPPDKAHRFVKHLEKVKSFDNPIAYSVLALGDKSYQHYCAFGHQLTRLFEARGATPITELVEVDKMNESTINQWWHKVTDALGWESSDIEQEKYLPLELTNNHCINPSSESRQVFSLCIQRKNLQYQAGDLLEVMPKQNEEQCLSRLHTLGIAPEVIVKHSGKNKTILAALTDSEWCQSTVNDAQQLADLLTPLAPRVYSIVSAPHQNEDIEIFVRRYIREDGTPGVASNFLAESGVGNAISARIKTHPNFHLTNDNAPVILIGAGTGIAPLISIIRELSTRDIVPPIWLFFGEQYQHRDFYFKTEINAYLTAGVIRQFTPAWSRSDNKEYVSDTIIRHQAAIANWLNNDNSHIYLCGNQQGFGHSTINAIKQVLTSTEHERLVIEDRIHVDLY